MTRAEAEEFLVVEVRRTGRWSREGWRAIDGLLHSSVGVQKLLRRLAPIREKLRGELKANNREVRFSPNQYSHSVLLDKVRSVQPLAAHVFRTEEVPENSRT